VSAQAVAQQEKYDPEDLTEEEEEDDEAPAATA